MTNPTTRDIPKPGTTELRDQLAELATARISAAINPVEIGRLIAASMDGGLQQVLRHERQMLEDRHAEDLAGAQGELEGLQTAWDELVEQVRRLHDEQHQPGYCVEPLCRAIRR